MNWQSFIADKRGKGWTLVTLARETGVSVSTISEIARGATHEPKVSLGDALRALPELPPDATDKREVA